MSAYVHGDDMAIIGEQAELEWLQGELEQKMRLKRRGLLGPDKEDDKSVRLLNRIITYGDNEITWEADARHVEIVLRDLNLDGKSAKAVATPGVKDRQFLDDRVIEGRAARQFRSTCMRLGFLAQDCPHL